MEVVFACAMCAACYPERGEFCAACGAYGSMYLRWDRTADALWRQGVHRASAAQIVAAAAKSVASSSYPELLIPPTGTLAIHGPPGAGKSSFLCKLADGFERPLIVSLEEGLGATLAARLRRLEIHRADFYAVTIDSISDLARHVEELSPTFIGIDSFSVSTLQIPDVLRLAADARCPVGVVLHETKDGSAAGPSMVLHAVDLVVRIERMCWRAEKSRLTPNIEGRV